MTARRAFFGTYWRGGLGAIGRCLALAHQLREKGFSCFFFADDVTREFVVQAGFHAVPPPAVEPPRQPSSSPYVSEKRIVGTSAVFANLSQFYGLRGYHDADYLIRSFDARFAAIREIDPDILVGYWSWETTIAARRMHRPVVTIIQKNLHPDGGGFGGEHSPLQDSVVIRNFNALLAKYGLPRIRMVEELMVGDVVLMSGVPSTDHVTSDSPVEYCGPMLWFSEDGKEALAELPADRKIAWVYATDDRDWVGGRTLIHEVVPALEDMGLFVLVGSGGYAVPDRQGPNVRCVRSVPGDLAARRADVVVGRGGHDLFWTAVMARTPFLGVPPNSEWLDYCKHARRLGVGDYVDTSEPLRETFVERARNLMESPDVELALDRLMSEARHCASRSSAMNVLTSRWPMLFSG